MRISDWSSDVCPSDLCDPRGIKLLLELRLAVDLFLLRLPALREFGGFLLKIRQFLFQIGEAVLRRRVGFLRPRFPFDLELADMPVQRCKLLGLALHLHAAGARCLVYQANGLVRQDATCDRSGEGWVGNESVRTGRS